MVQPAIAERGTMSNLTPTIFSFSVYADTGLVLDVIARDSNEGADISHIRVDVHETTNPSSTIVCWFETPTNLTITLGGSNGEYALVFKRLTSTEAQPISTGEHLFVVNATDDDGEYATDTAIYDFDGSPQFINIAADGSYIHRSDNNPTPDQVVEFTAYVRDYNTPPAGLTIQFHYSRDGRVTWDTRSMVYDTPLDNWVTSLGPFPGRTEIYYYVTAYDDDVTTRTPADYDFLVWDPAGLVPRPSPTVEYLTLYKGWNLVSIGLITSLTVIALIQQDEYIEAVVRRKLDGNYETAIRGAGETDFDMEYEYGYFIYVSQVTVVAISGTPATTESLWLYPGWNMYGVSRDTTSSEVTGESGITTIVGRSFIGKYWTYDEDLRRPDMTMRDDNGFYLYTEEGERWYP